MTDEELQKINEADFERLLAQNKAARSVFDSKLHKGVSSGVNTALEKMKGEQEQDAEAKLADREKILDRKERALALAVEKGIEPQTAFTLLGLDDSDDETRLDTVEQIRIAERKKIIVENGRTPHVTLNTSRFLDLDKRLTPEQQGRLSAETIALAEKQLLNEGRPSPWKNFREKLFGGQE